MHRIVGRAAPGTTPGSGGGSWGLGRAVGGGGGTTESRSGQSPRPARPPRAALHPLTRRPLEAMALSPRLQLFPWPRAGNAAAWRGAPARPPRGPVCRFSDHGPDAQRPHGVLAVPAVPATQRWRWARAPPGREGGVAGAGAGLPPGPSSPTGPPETLSPLLPPLRGHRRHPAPSHASSFAPASEPVSLLTHEGGGQPGGRHTWALAPALPRPYTPRRPQRACFPLCISQLHGGGPGRFFEAGGGWGV